MQIDANDRGRAGWLDDRKMPHVRGAPYHPQTQGKIERWHQTLKNRILLENYYLPGDLAAQVETFVDHYNHDRYRESLDNLAPADVYFGRAAGPVPNALVSNDRPSTIDACSTASSPININLPDEDDTPLIYATDCLKSFDDAQ